MAIQLKRAYEEAKRGDGFRILVDRIWPRGVSKEAARIDLWLKEVAPSTALRKWFAHNPEKWPAFRKKYFSELKKHPDEIAELRARIGKGRVSLIYAAKDTEHNNAVALQEFLEA